MKQRKITRGTPPPLFDRIVDDKNNLITSNHLLNSKELKTSIMEELSLILNTRCTVRKVIYENHLETIPFFGLPDFFGLGDFSYFDGSNSQDWPKAERFIGTAIQAAEPRLQNVNVGIESYDPVRFALHVRVSGIIKENDQLKEIHFPIALQHNPKQ